MRPDVNAPLKTMATTADLALSRDRVVFDMLRNASTSTVSASVSRHLASRAQADDALSTMYHREWTDVAAPLRDAKDRSRGVIGDMGKALEDRDAKRYVRLRAELIQLHETMQGLRHVPDTPPPAPPSRATTKTRAKGHNTSKSESKSESIAEAEAEAEAEGEVEVEAEAEAEADSEPATKSVSSMPFKKSSQAHGSTMSRGGSSDVKVVNISDASWIVNHHHHPHSQSDEDDSVSSSDWSVNSQEEEEEEEEEEEAP